MRRGAAEPASEGPGAAAIDRRVDRIDGGPEVHRYRPRAPHRFRGAGPLRAVTSHRLADPDHFHLVTYGLTELAEKQSDNLGRSGWGFELTLRVAAGPPTTPGDDPSWAVDLLTNLAAYVWTSGHGFAAGDHIDLRGPIRLGHDSALTAAALVVDPTLGRMRGPFGRLSFLQLVALTADELEVCRTAGTDAVVAVLAERDPLLVTRLDRESVLDDPAVSARLRMGEASPLTELGVATLSVRRGPTGTVVQLGAGASAALGPALPRALTEPGAGFSLVGDDVSVVFTVTDEARWEWGPGRLVLDVPLDEVEGLAGMFDGRTGWGRRPAWPGLRWHVVP